MRQYMLFVIAFLAAQWGTGRGNRSQREDDKIVGGSEVREIAEIPYIVAISIIYSNCTEDDAGKKKCAQEWYFTCGGSLLNSYYVITACHCMVDFENTTKHMTPIPMTGFDGNIVKIEDFRYVAGSRKIHPLDETAQIRIPSELHHHPQCAQEDVRAISDVGFAKMEKPFQINKFVQPLKVFSSERRTFQNDFDSMLKNNPRCQVSGWGSTSREHVDQVTNEHKTNGAKHEVSFMLKTAKMDVLTQEMCLKKFMEWGGDEFNEIELDFKKLDQICIWSPKGNEGFCSGDSGSPFVCNGYFIALVSNSIECGTPLPQVCQTAVSLFDWMRRDFCKQSDCSDMIYKVEPLNRENEPTSAVPVKIKKEREGSLDGGSNVVKHSPIVTVIAIQLANKLI